MPHLSKNQKKILEILDVKPEMTTKEIAEMIYGRICRMQDKKSTLVSRNLRSLKSKALSIEYLSA
jgi:hypothetical protein